VLLDAVARLQPAVQDRLAQRKGRDFGCRERLGRAARTSARGAIVAATECRRTMRKSP